MDNIHTSVWCLILQLLLQALLIESTVLHYNITQQWNGDEINHRQTEISLSWNEGDDFLTAVFSGRFFHDPAPPHGTPGQPFPELWKYEVAEIFFLAPSNKYLEVEVSPSGPHLLLLLDGKKNPIKDMLPMKYDANISRESMTWIGKAEIPLSYLPHNVSLMNAYAIHGHGKQRMYEALYPVPTGKYPEPDFHRLEYFMEIPIASVVKDMSKIGKYWDSLTKDDTKVDSKEDESDTEEADEDDDNGKDDK